MNNQLGWFYLNAAMSTAICEKQIETIGYLKLFQSFISKGDFPNLFSEIDSVIDIIVDSYNGNHKWPNAISKLAQDYYKLGFDY